MSYCTVDEVKRDVDENVLVYLLYPDPETADTSDLEERIAAFFPKVDGTIDGFLEGRYPLPLSFSSKLLTTLATDLAVYELFARKGFRETTADKVVVDKHKNAMKLLELIGQGKITLRREDVPAPERNVAAEIDASERVFSRDSLKEF